MAVVLEENSPKNIVENEVFFLIDLEGVGYLKQDTDWDTRIADRVFIEEGNFVAMGTPALFDSVPTDVLGWIDPVLRPGIRVMRRFTVHVLEEVIL